jgi:hypothetical protein
MASLQAQFYFCQCKGSRLKISIHRAYGKETWRWPDSEVVGKCICPYSSIFTTEMYDGMDVEPQTLKGPELVGDECS